VKVADEFGVDLHGAVPKGYDALTSTPDLVVSVCDRAHESGPVSEAPSFHWSVPDPVPDGSLAAFRASFAAIEARIDRLAHTSDRPIHTDHAPRDASRRLA
jgi:protein-tyrosine-phosphatase